MASKSQEWLKSAGDTVQKCISLLSVYSGFAVLVHSFTRYSLDTCYVLDTISVLRKVWDETVIKQSRSIELVSC